MAADSAFVDTNVLVYVSHRSAIQHSGAVAALQRLEREGADVWISRQILREYLSAVTRPQTTVPALPIETAVADIRRFMQSFQVAEDGPAVMDHLLDLLQRFPTGGRQVHDANVMATMLAYGIPRLITFNAEDLRRFSGLIQVELP